MKLLLLTLLILFVHSAHAQQVRITDLDDLDAGTWSGQAGNINLEDDICIYSDTGGYDITASGTGAGGTFRVADGGNFVNYQVRWNDVAGTTTGQTRLTQNATLTGQTTTETISNDCSGGASPTARLQIRYQQNQLQRRPSGTYSGTLTLVIGVE